MAKNKAQETEGEIEPGTEMELDSDHADARVYELGFHLDPELPQEEAKKAYQSLRDLISSNGTVIAEGEIDKISLAYTISRMETGGRRDFNSSYFGWISYEATGEGHEAILSGARAETRMVRFLDIRSSKDEAQHSAEMHEFYRRAPQLQNEDLMDDEEVAVDAPVEAAADAELEPLKEASV